MQCPYLFAPMDTFDATNEPTMICHYFPRFIRNTLRCTLAIVHSMGFDKYVMTCAHCYSVIKSSFTALKYLCVLPVLLFSSCACCVLGCSVVSDSETPWTVACQAPLFMGTLQARILEWVAMPSSSGSCQPRDRAQVSHIAGRFFTD